MDYFEFIHTLNYQTIFLLRQLFPQADITYRYAYSDDLHTLDGIEIFCETSHIAYQRRRVDKHDTKQTDNGNGNSGSDNNGNGNPILGDNRNVLQRTRSSMCKTGTVTRGPKTIIWHLNNQA